MPVRRILTSAAVAVLVVGLGASSASAADTRTERARDAVAAATGLQTEALTSPRTLDAGRVSPAAAPDGTSLPTLLHDDGAQGYALVAVLDRGRSLADFTLDLPDGTVLEPTGDGGLRVVDRRSARTVGTVDAPWAVDAVGTRLPTRYSVLADGTLRQHVDTAGAVFPVAADPRVTFGVHRGIPVAYAQWNRSETLRIAKIAGPVGAVATAICGTLQVDWRVRAACSVMIGPYAADMVTTAQTAARTPGRCFKMRVPLYPVAATIWLTYDSYHVPC